jgi:nicotinamidase-related amidase
VTRLEPERTLVLVVDVQEKLAAAMPEAQMTALSRAATILLGAAGALGARTVATEQYPQGLGPTLAPLRAQLSAAGATILAKTEFSACDAPSFADAFAAAPPRSVVVLGMETHVCVFQTVRDLAARGLDVHVPIDGVASRRDDHRQAGLDLCRAAGATLTTAETIAFDWLRRAGGDAFKTISMLVR